MKKKTGLLFVLSVAGYLVLAWSSCARPDNTDAFGDTRARAVTGCPPTNIVPYIQVNDGAWTLNNETIVAPGSKVKFGPQPVITNGWSWTGGGTSGTNREQTIYPAYSVYPLASFTNNCGSTEYESFTIHVTHVKNWGFESGGNGDWSGYGQYAIVNNNAYSGTYAGRIYSTGGSSGITQTVTGLTPNTDYVLKARVKTTANTVVLGVGEFGGGNPTASTSSNQYVLLSLSFKTGAAATSALVYLWRNTSGYAYIDDVIVERNVSPSGDAPPIWVEEFNGSALNTNIWTPLRGTEPYTYGTPYNPSSENNGYAKSMVSVANGNLVIKWENTPITAGGTTYSYTSGTVHSGKSKYFGPGHYIEAKIKFTSTPGLLLAFWLVPIPVDDHWPPEIDITEFTTSDTPDGLYHPHFNYHWAENGVHKQMGWKWYGTSGVDYGNDWHTYGLLWEQGFLQVFVDGEAGPLYQAPNVTSEEMYIVLNAAIKKNTAPANGQMLVDYVKVWKR